jgi:hypothetical protein
MERKAVDRVKKGCKRCGSTDVAWHQSERGKWYLIEVFNDPRDGMPIGSYRDFHSAYCKGERSHAQVQAELDADHAEQESAREQAAKDRENARIANEARMMQEFAELDSQGRADFIANLKAKREAHGKVFVTMDYMTEYTRHLAESESMDREIEFYEDFNADLVDVGEED